MKKIMMTMTVVTLAAAVALAAPASKGKKGAAKVAEDQDAPAVGERDVSIKQFPNLGKQTLQNAPSLGGINQYFTKPRQWIVLELAYDTMPRNLDMLTFTWHVVLDTKTATNKDREGQKKLSPYSYFTATTTYNNIPRGTHASSVVLHPSYLECYGEPCAVSVVISDSSGKVIDGRTEGIAPFKKKTDPGYKFWEDDDIMNKTFKDDILWVTRRNGLQDRGKTIWALVKPNDYELTLQ